MDFIKFFSSSCAEWLVLTIGYIDEGIYSFVLNVHQAWIVRNQLLGEFFFFFFLIGIRCPICSKFLQRKGYLFIYFSFDSYMKKVYVNFELCNSNKLLERNDTLFANWKQLGWKMILMTVLKIIKNKNWPVATRWWRGYATLFAAIEKLEKSISTISRVTTLYNLYTRNRIFFPPPPPPNGDRVTSIDNPPPPKKNVSNKNRC